MRVAAAAAVLLASSAAWADAPALDDFFERERTRLDDFTPGESTLVRAIAGVETANPSADGAPPTTAIGVRLGGELGWHGRARDAEGLEGGGAPGEDVVTTRVIADVLRVSGTGAWITNAAWHSLAFADLAYVQLSADAVVARKDELEASDVAALATVPYTSVDGEAEIAVIGPPVDKDTRLAVPIGVANRLRWEGGDTADRRTSVSAAIAARGFVKDVRTHAQLDFGRVTYTEWSGGTRATTIAAGYQRLPEGIDTLPLWALVGYQWAGDRSGAVAQIGMDLPLHLGGTLRIQPAFDRHFDLDIATRAITRVTAAKLGATYAIGPVTCGATYEAAAVEATRRYQAITPSVAVGWRGLQLGLGYRITLASHETAPMTALPRDRFMAVVDQRF